MFKKVCKAINERRPFLRLDLIADIGLEKGIIDSADVQLLRKAEEHRLYAINVDDFDPKDLAAKPLEITPQMDEVA